MAAETMAIADHGDIILVVGQDENTIRLKVDTHLLRAASCVFKVMLGPNFAEGQNLKCAEPKEVLLPEDNPDSIKLICQVVHMKTESLPQRLKANTVEMLTQTIHKYSFNEAMRLAMEIWLNPRSTKSFDVDDLAVWLEAAIILQYPVVYESTTESIVMYWCAPFTDLADPVSSVVPWRVIHALEEKRTSIRTQAYQAILDAAFRRLYHADEYAACRPNYGYKLLDNAQSVGLTPAVIATKALDDVFDQIRGLPDAVADVKCPNGSIWHNKTCPTQMREEMMREIKRVKAFRGLCYYCTCDETSSKGEKKCDCNAPPNNDAAGWGNDTGGEWDNSTTTNGWG